MSKKVKATKKKLIEDYKSTIIKMSSENSLLQKQISDIETTLNINQNILYNMILNYSTEKNLEEKKNLINTLKNLWKENINLLENKNIIQEKLSNLQEASEELPNKIREEMFYYQKRNEKDKVEIKKLEEKITNLQENLKNIRRNNFHKDATIEVYVTSPNKKNVENNHEILNIISILDKLKDLPKEKEETAKKIKLEVDQLIKQVKLLKQNFYQKNNNINDITKINEEDINKYVKENIINYNLLADENEIEIDSDEENEEEENDDDNKFNNGSKNLKIELDKLIKEYEEMKIQCKEYEKIIEEHKRKYKNVEGKINSLKQSIDI
jgi:hypothetical protein